MSIYRASCIGVKMSSLPAGVGKTVQAVLEYVGQRLNRGVVSVTESATIEASTLVQLVDAPGETTQTLPVDATEGYIVHIKRVGAGNIVVAPPATHTIDGVATWDFTTNSIAQGGTQAFVFDGTDAWYTFI